MAKLIDKLRVFLFKRDPKWIRRERDWKRHIEYEIPRTSEQISYAFVREDIVKACEQYLQRA